MLKCLFNHQWVYSEKVEMKFNKKLSNTVYTKRECNKCDKVQENNGYFDTSMGFENIWRDKWVTIRLNQIIKKN